MANDVCCTGASSSTRAGIRHQDSCIIIIIIISNSRNGEHYKADDLLCLPVAPMLNIVNYNLRIAK